MGEGRSGVRSAGRGILLFPRIVRAVLPVVGVRVRLSNGQMIRRPTRVAGRGRIRNARGGEGGGASRGGSSRIATSGFPDDFPDE